MKKVDILFLYETRVRELENICLLKYELERRGYTVAVQNTWNELAKKTKPKYDAKVVVTHAMYHDGIYQFVQSIVGNVPKVVNMQCEQVGTLQDDEAENSRFVLQGVAAQSMNICWGRKSYDRLLNRSKISPDYLRLTGQITLDFCRPELKGYYKTRQELEEEYNLPGDCQLNLFISSFAYVNLPDSIAAQSDIQDKSQFIKCSRDSFNGVLQWFDAFLTERKDQTVVYRPHPAEADNPVLKELCKKHPGRFFVISQYSVKQWVAISDRVYTWYSSAGAEVYTFGVPFGILRPVEMPRSMEVELFKNARFITDYQGFLTSVDGGNETVIDPEVFAELYDVQPTMSYIRVADAIEEVLKNDRYLLKNAPVLPKKTFSMKMKEFAHKAVALVADRLPEDSQYLKKYRTPQQVVDDYTLQRRQNNYATDEEIEEIQQKISRLLSR